MSTQDEIYAEEDFVLLGAKVKPRKRKRELLSEEKFLELGRKHFAKDFPNPERRGCPPRGELKLLAEKPMEGRESAVKHIATCSPCYRAYSRFLQRKKMRLRAKSAGND